MKRKHCLLIGGTRGIGTIIAKNLSKDGYIVSVVGRNVSKTDTSRITYWVTDLEDEEKTKETLGSIVSRSGSICSLIFCQRYRNTKDNWQGELNVSLTATKNIIEWMMPYFSKTGEESVVVISSVVSRFVAFDQPVGYHVVKSALNQLVRYYAVRLGSKGIRVNSVSPATVLKEENTEFYKKNDTLITLYNQLIPLGRMGTPEDMYHAIAFLLSHQSSFITGQDIVVDGGLSLLAHESLIHTIHEK